MLRKKKQKKTDYFNVLNRKKNNILTPLESLNNIAAWLGSKNASDAL